MSETVVPVVTDSHDAAGDPARDSRIEALRRTLELRDDERLERVYVFEPLERKDVAFSLALVTKRLPDGRLEMVALGGRTSEPDQPAHDFVRRARFPVDVLPAILTEFVDRCGVEGAAHREVDLSGGGPSDLAGVLFPTCPEEA